MNWKKTANLFLSMMLAFSTMMSEVTVFAEGEEEPEEFVTEEVIEFEGSEEPVIEEVTETGETEEPVIEETTEAEETAEPEVTEPVTEENDETDVIADEDEGSEEEITDAAESEEPEQEEEPSEQETAEPVPEEGEDPSEEIPADEEETSETFAVSGDYQYTLSNNTVTITKYLGTDEVVVIPSAIDGHSVTAIGDSAFAEDENITIVTVPSGVKTIGANAFSSSEYLEEIKLPDGLISIGDSAFNSCTSLTSIKIPDSVTTLGKDMFFHNSSLEEVKLPANLTALPSRIFSNCFSLKNITIPGSVKSIGSEAFEFNESLEEIEIPNGVTTLNSYVFNGCINLSKVTIPASVTKIANGGVFGDSTNLKTAGPIGSGSDIEFGWTVTIPENAFIRIPTLTTAEIPYGVKTIGTSAFDYCENLTAVTIPETVKVIKPAAFQNCSSLKDVYYYGTAEDWNKITIEQGNDPLKKATFHYKGIQLRALKINAEDGEIILHAGENRTLGVTRTPANSGEELYWETSDGNTLTVDQHGTVTAIKSGSAVITVRNQDDSISDSVQIIVATEVTGITLNKTESTLAKGKEEQLTATVKPDNATFKDVKWSSNNRGVVKVDANGLVTAVGGGTAVITAEADGGLTASCTYTVLVPVAGISADESINVPLEKDTEISYQIEPTDATNQKVIFTTGNAEIAKVSADGIVTGLKLGETNITVKTEDGGYQAVVHITVAPDGIYMDPIEESYPYTGSAIKPAVKLYDQGTLLKEKTNYTVSYANNTKAGTATINIKLTGNYKGTIKQTFEITQIDLNDLSCDALTMAETGKTLNPVPAVYFNSKKLKNGTDFKITKYTVIDPETGEEKDWDRKSGGEPVLTLTGFGNYSGEKKVTVFVLPKEGTGLQPVSKLKISAKSLEYQALTGDNFIEEIIPALTVKNGTYGTDFTVNEIPDHYRETGVLKFTITGIGKWYGERTVSVKITGVSLSDKKVKNNEIGSYVYNGKEQTLNDSFYLTYGEVRLEEGKDYQIVSYSNNINAGKASAKIKGLNGFTGTRTVNFTIGKNTDSITEDDVSYEETVEYAKGGAKPVIKVFDEEIGLLTAGKDYTVKYANHTKITDTASFTLTFTGNYKGTKAIRLPYKVTAKDIGKTNLTVKDVVWNAAAGKYRSTPSIKDTDGKALKAGTDYLKTYTYELKQEDGSYKLLDAKSTVSAGSVVRIIVEGTGKYFGTISGEYKVMNAADNIAKAVFTVANQEYTGREIRLNAYSFTKAEFTGGAKLKYGTDYKVVSYTNNIKKGTASAVLQGIGQYGGTKTVKFKIVQKEAEYYWQKDGTIRLSGINASYIDNSTVTITFSKAAFGKEDLNFYEEGWDEEPYKVENANIITLQPDSTVLIRDSIHGNKTGFWPFPINGEYYGQYPRGIYLSSGNVSDWERTIFGNDVIGLYSLTILNPDTGTQTVYFIRIAE
ncbi:MAG TPA: hypothetical protein DCG51_09845 [Erysipelotrichaceae bacterium]|nr:hypothetical protein [Erysipelotrichaceae bacterium]